MDLVKENVEEAVACSLPAALEVVGERWSFLILRDAFNGIRHFEEFQSTMGIARNILANRLGRLVTNGILSRKSMTEDRRKIEYCLTDKGAALLPVVVSLRQWAEEWEVNGPSTIVLVDELHRQPVRKIGLYSVDGRELSLQDLCWASAKNVRSLRHLQEAQAA
ncbi:helix-turn-helix domain-containing protein [Sphingomonas sp.]|uniref:winged helix-turn-helix transcriptional regulator n=1 Tax=Sphingomonas sp. TaxID=28214 RepID=UPI0025F41A36|nr:helix-turn-helix domain-containing protein [Sphingomonas sp.]